MSKYKIIIDRASSAIQETFDNVMGCYVTEQDRAVVEAFTLYLIQLATYNLFSPRSIIDLVDSVWNKTEHRDFIMSMTIGFHVRLAADSDEYSNLVGILTESIVQTNGSDSSIPLVVRDRLPTESDVNSLLFADKWLVTVVLINQFISIRKSSRTQVRDTPRGQEG